MKDKILAEIRRLALESGGIAPGKAIFQQRTGIADSDWLGKIWVRWSDAVEEAGYTPNQMRERLPAEFVLDKYEEVCRHFGKIPTSYELRFYARSRPNFPAHNTFSNHFGNKAGLIAALRSRATHRGDEGIIAMLPADSKGTTTAQTVSQEAADGWVYLLQSDAYYKIGRSQELEKRIKQINVALPAKAELVHSIRTDDTAGIEAYWHRRFADLRVNGEWFKLGPADVRAFKRRKFQ